MPKIHLELSEDHYHKLIEHLLQPDGCEQAAFGFAKVNHDDSVIRFQIIDCTHIPSIDCTAQSAYYLELSDRVRSQIIKQAHALDASLIEFHSHRSAEPAVFSITDFSGFHEFVPHVWWRLNGRPYAAVVFAETSLDAIAWIADAEIPLSVTEIRTEAKTFRPTGRSLGGNSIACSAFSSQRIVLW